MIQSYKQYILLTFAVLFGWLAFSADSALAATTLNVRNVDHPTYTPNSVANTSARAEPGDTLEFRMLSSGAASTGMTIVLPADLTYATTTTANTGAVATVNASGQTINWTYPSTSAAVIFFRATVAGGAALSTNHNLSLSLTTNTALTSNSITVTTGPIITAVSPNTGGDLSGVNVTLTGHGFTQVGDISSIVLMPGNINIVQSLAVSSAGSGLYTITGVRVNAGTASGTYYIVVTTSKYNGVAYTDPVSLANNADSTESVTYIVDGARPNITSYSANQNGDTSGNVKAGSVVFTATFDGALSAVPKIAINQPGTADIVATNMTLVSGNTYNYTYTVESATGGTYVDGSATATISNATDLAGNVMTSVDNTFTIDTTKPVVQAFQIVEGANTAGTVMAGTATITITMDGAVTTVPKIAINQPGTTDIAATNMTAGAGNTFTYDYTVHSATEAGYSDGTATVTVSLAADSFGNVMNADSTRTFTINTVTPIVSNYTINQGANTSGYVKAGVATISITMSQAVTTVPKIAINQPGTTDISAIDMTLLSGNIYTYDYTVQTPTGGTYVDGTANITISAAATSLGNTMLDSAHTFVIDNVKPTVSLTSVTQGANSSGNVKSGSATITFTADETLSVVPKIAIDQAGTTDNVATDMTLASGNIYNYIYTVNSATGGTYIDGTATTTITIAADRAGNVMDANSANTFTVDTTAPTPAISDLATPTSAPTEVALSWTAYTGSDFSTYKVYYRPNSAADSANGTLVSVASSATAGTAITGLTSGTNYFFAIYICDQADNCSAKSNDVSRSTSSAAAIIVVTSSGGGGGGGSSAPAATTSSTAGSVGSTGGTVTNTTASGTAAAVTIPANTFSASTSITASEASATEKQSATIAPAVGTVLGSSVFSLQATSNSTAVTSFSQPITLEFTYTLADLGNVDSATLRLAYYDTTSLAWVALTSTVDPFTRKVRAETTHFTLFAIVSFVNPPATTTPPPTTSPTTEETGQVLGSSVGAYPNGVLLKAPNSPTIWHISGDQKHAIPSPAVFLTRFNWLNVIKLPSAYQLDLYEQGADVKFAANTLIKIQGESAVYRVSVNGGLQPVISGRVFLDRFYQFSDVITVPASLVASYPREEVIANSQTIYDGELVSVPQKGKKAPVYYVADNLVREFPFTDIFVSHAFKLKRIRAITAGELAVFTVGPDMVYPDGTLVKGQGPAVYVISDGRKRPIKSAADFNALLFDWKKIKHITETQLSQINTAGEIRLVDANTLHLAAQ